TLSAIRLFQDGMLVWQQTGVTGTITETPYDNMNVGPVFYPMERSGYSSPVAGAIESVRLSKVIRNDDGVVCPVGAAAGTLCFPSPVATPAKLTNDASTLALVNFDTQRTGLTLAQTAGGPAWLPVRRFPYTHAPPFQPDFTPGYVSQHLHDFTVAGGGIYTFNA